MKQPPYAITLTNISKKYEIHHEKPTLVEQFVKGRNETFWALRHLDLSVREGERVGIVGANGSGKTTLLKIMAGITTPTNGTLSVKGKIISLIDLEAGFHADLTGFQNIYLNGMLLGLSRTDIDRKMRSIIAFADLKQFIDAPLFTYSAGMALRLGFAVAVHANPDILLLDENLSAGDSEFQNKIRAKIMEFCKKGKTIITVTHYLRIIEQLCTRVIHMQNGAIVHDGGLEVLSLYDKWWKPSRTP